MSRTLAAVIVLSALPALADEQRVPAAAVAPMRRAPSKTDPNDPLGAGYMPNRPPTGTKPPAPKPPAEVAALAKELGGTWTCKGNTLRGDGSSTPLTATVTSKLDLDNAWIATTLVERGGPLKWTAYRTYDAVAKQWSRIQLVNTAGYVTSTSPGEQGGKWTWTGAAIGGGGTLQVRDYEQKDGKALKVWGEAMVGGVWGKLFEVTCTK